MLLENISDTSIENNFWSSDKTALNILLNRLEESNNSTRSIQQYFKQRAEIEEEYGNQLLRLSQSFAAEEIFRVIPIASEMTARAHIDLGQNIKNMLELPLDTYIKDQENVKLYMTNQMKESQNMKMIHTENVERARENYFNECQNSNANQKDIDVLDFEYQKAVTLMESNAKNWINQWQEACKTFQFLENHRLDYLKAVIKTFSTMISCAYNTDDQTCERITIAMEDLSANQEVAKFVRTYRTGSTTPGVLKYVKYNMAPKKPANVKKEKNHTQLDIERKIKDIKIPVKDDEELRSVNDQLKLIPMHGDNVQSTKESNEVTKNADCIPELQRNHTSPHLVQYPLSPIYKLNRKSPSQSDPALHSWMNNNNNTNQDDTRYNTKSTLITPHEKNIYMSKHESKYSPTSLTKKPSILLSSIGFLKKKKKPDEDKNRKKLTLNQDIQVHNSTARTPPSPLFSPIDFYYSPASEDKNALGNKIRK